MNRVPGSGYEKQRDTESAKQIQERIAKMKMDRETQDKMWSTPKATPALTAMVEKRTNFSISENQNER